MGAWSAIIINGNDKKIITGQEHDTTHQRMELLSVISAIRFIIETYGDKISITLFTDSQYVVGLHNRKEKLLSGSFKNKKDKLIPNADLLIELYNLFEKITWSIIKLKSHQKDSVEERLNGEADKLCRNIVRTLVNKIQF
jgi:ribonuclease HI